MSASDDGYRCSEDETIVWSDLKFKFRKTKHYFLAHTSSGSAGSEPQWSKGKVLDFDTDEPIKLSPAAAVLNYGQAGFEGLKATRTPDDEIVLFRPEENARRFCRTAARLSMPPYPVEQFVADVEALVREEAAYVPPYALPDWPANCPPGSRSLYIRPVMIGSGAQLGVSPAPSYTFYIFVSPVGVYREKGPLVVLDSTHRAPAYGIGDVKAAANYPATLRPYALATQDDDSRDVLYLDARHDQYIEEVGSSNFFAILKDGTLVTPRLGSILPGITRDSIITIARELLGWRVVERDITLKEVLDDAEEVFYTGTAAVVVPVTRIYHKGTYQAFAADKTDNTKANHLKERLTAIQTRRKDDPFGWVRVVKVEHRPKATVVPARQTAAAPGA